MGTVSIPQTSANKHITTRLTARTAKDSRHITDFIYYLTDKFFGSCPAHPNPLICSIGNYSLADIHRQYKKIKQVQSTTVLLKM